jgi:5-methylcytosine-specific restriction endonuclease McrBC regulatory subunit McrC
VTIREFLPRQSPAFHYDRLNSRYRDVHSWCRFFIDLLSLSDKSGSRPFHAYLLDMNVLFERFVISIFERAQTFVPLVAVQHHKSYPLTTNGTLQVCPDVTLKGPNNLQIAVDAKYKRTNGNTAKHPDLYQVVSYCTSLGLIGQDATPMQGILVYPSDQRTSELDGVLKVITSKGGSSELSIRVLWLDLASENVVSEAIKSFIVVLRGMTIPDVT